MHVTIFFANLKLNPIRHSYNKPLNYFLNTIHKQKKLPNATINWKLPRIKRTLLVKFL